MFQSLQEIFKDVIEMKKKMKVIVDAKKQEKLCDQMKNEILWARVSET